MELALLYVYGGPDLYTPGASSIGHLDAMGLAHMLGLPGHLLEVAGIGPKVPLLEPDHVVSYGAYLDEDDPEQVLLDKLEIVDISAADIHRHVYTAAARAIDHVEAVAPAFVVHCDADVLAFADTPLSDSPDSGGDPHRLDARRTLHQLGPLRSEPAVRRSGAHRGESDHAPEPDDIRRFARAVGTAVEDAKARPVD